MKGKHSLRLLAIYSLNEQNQRTKTRSRRGKKNRGLLLTLERKKEYYPWKRFELHCGYTFNAEYFVTHEVPVFIVRSPPCWINFYVYLSPISIFFLIHNQFLSWLTPLRQLFVVCDDHRPRYWVGRQLLYLKLTIGPLAFKYKSYHPIMFREDLSSLYWVPMACLYCPPPALNGHVKLNLTNKT